MLLQVVEEYLLAEEENKQSRNRDTTNLQQLVIYIVLV